MATYEDLVRVDPAAYAEEAHNWQKAADGIRDRGNDLDQKIKKLEDWQGAAADAAKAKLSGYRKQYADAATTMAQIAPVLNDAAQRFGRTKGEAQRLVDEARSAGWDFDREGKVVVPGPPPVSMAGLEPNARRLQDAMSTHVAECSRTDADTANALRRLSAQSAGLAAPDHGTVAAAATTIPPRSTAPTDVKRWWDSLSPMQQESLLFTHAGEIGALDGVPAVARDRANRSRLAELQGQLDAEKQRLEAKGGQLTPQERDRLADIDGKLKGILAITGRLNPADGTKQQAFLLSIDTAVNGRAIIAMGNPDTATNLCTSVPGTGAKLAGASGEMERADRMHVAAARAGSPSTSIIAWIGYDAPQSVFPEAASESYAEGGRKDLDRFQDGLRATHEGPRSHNVVLGHSYGTTVIGHAAHHERLDVDGVVLLGSPGLGVAVGNAKDLNLPPEHVYASTAENDSIRHTNNPDSYNDPLAQAADPHGRNPADPRFGGHVFSSSPGTPGGMLGSTEAHSEYWDTNKRSLPNIGRIIAGKSPD